MISYYNENSNKYLFVIHEASQGREIQFFTLCICNISGKIVYKTENCVVIVYFMWVFGAVVVDNAVKVVLLDDEGSAGCCCCSYVGCIHSLGTG